MNITVRLFATFRENRGKELNLDMPEGATPRSVAASLEIAESEVAILLINGRDGSMDGRLTDGDRVALFPPVGGG